MDSVQSVNANSEKSWPKTFVARTIFLANSDDIPYPTQGRNANKNWMT